MQTESIKSSRAILGDRHPNRDVVNDNGNLVLYFVNADPALQPNHQALKLHSTTCFLCLYGRWLVMIIQMMKKGWHGQEKVEKYFASQLQ